MESRFLNEAHAQVTVPEHLFSLLAPPACPQLRLSFTFLGRRERHLKILGSQHLKESKHLICGESTNKKNQAFTEKWLDQMKGH